MDKGRTKDAIRPMFLQVDLTEAERARFNKHCGPGQRIKRAAWVREAILAHMDRDDGK